MAAPRRKSSSPPVAKLKPGKTAGKSKGRRSVSSKSSGSSGGIRQIWRYLYRSLLVGGLLGSLVVGLGFYRYAQERVASRLSGEVWELPGKIYAGPLDIWPGLKLSPEALASDLSAAGYARVPQASHPGDYSLEGDSLHIIRKAASYPGYEIKSTDVTIQFAEGRVKDVTGGRAILPPPVIASIRGADNEERNPLSLSHIPLQMQQAVLAMEDARFYKHPGVDIAGIARAMVINVAAGGFRQGGSTLTQQLAKNLFLSPERSYGRKIEEAFLALALEQRLGKERILQMYLNEIYLGQAGGGSICGVDAAARAWFGKSVERVSLGEAATIAGVISAPNAYSPLKHLKEAKERRDIALGRMADVGVITEAEAEKAIAEPLVLHPAEDGKRAPWVVDAAIEKLEGELGEGSIARDGLSVYTTIHPALQRAAEDALEEGLSELEAANPKLKGIQGALVAVRAKDGAVLALVGGRGYGETYYNRALHAERQVGSTIKGLSMLIAFESDAALGPATRLDDAPLTLTIDGKDWSPKNYDNAYIGPISIRKAIATSRNIPAVKLAQQVGMTQLEQGWEHLGLSQAPHNPAAALGGFEATPLQLAGAYGVFATNGTYHPPYLVSGAMGEAGTAWTATEEKTTHYSARATFLAADVLRGVIREGTGKGAARWGVGPDLGGKSGTTDHYTDAWFTGFTSEISVAVWVGFDKQQPINLTGSQAALPIWARFMAWTGLTGGTITPPAGVVQIELCNETELPPCPGCLETRQEWFSAGHVPAAACGIFAGRSDTTTGEGSSPPAAPPASPLKKLGDWLGMGRPH